MTAARKRYLSLTIKVLILLLSGGFIYYKLSDHQNLRSFQQLLRDLPFEKSAFTISLVVLLMLLNWGLEALKWKWLVRKIQIISFSTALASVFSGLTWAVFTPNRIGEYGGRVFFLAPRKRVYGAVAMGVGSLAQMVLTNVFGSFALVWFMISFIRFTPQISAFLIAAAALYSLLFLLLYFRISLLERLISRLGFLKSFRKFFLLLKRYQFSDLLRIFLLSMLRMLVFTCQYLLLLFLLIPAIPAFPSLMMIGILFFIQSALPSLDLLDIGVRTFTSAYFFGHITEQEVAVMAVAAFIWLVNLILPAVIGMFFVFKIKFFGGNH